MKSILVGSAVAVVLFCVLMVLACMPAVAKEKKDKPQDPASAPIALSADEVKDATIAEQKAQILELQIEKLQTQVMEARQRSNEEIQAMTARFAKAHDIDISKYRLDMAKKEFVPLPAPPDKK